MSTFNTFEEIESWQMGRKLTQAVYAASKSGEFSRDWGLKDQIRRASVSITSNIAEGFERSSTREFIRFLDIAKGSAGEVRSQLYVALDEGYIDRESFERLRRQSTMVGKKIGGLMSYLRRHDQRTTRNP